MTMTEVCTQLHSLALGGFFNGEKFSRERFTAYVRNMFRTPLAGGNKLVMQIALPDGWWYFYITQYAKGEFDYYIPDTREQEHDVLSIIRR